MVLEVTPDRIREHEAVVARVRQDLDQLPTTRPVRLAKATSNLFRRRDDGERGLLDVTGLTGVVDLDLDHPAGPRARVGGMTTYEQLVDELLPYGVMPLVVPQLRTITIGGAITGLGIEATSFRNGLPHESALELEILTGNADIVRATPDGEHAELFHTFPNSYGSLGYTLGATIELERTSRYVAVRHLRFDRLTDLVDTVEAVMAEQTCDGERVDFLDGVVFGPRESYLSLGRWTDDLEGRERPSRYAKDAIYYRSIQHRRRDLLAAHDWLWRWDTDWFWCSRAFGAQHPTVRRLWPERWLRSDVYWRIVAFEQRRGVMAAIERARGLPPRERVVQDVEIPLERVADFLTWFLHEVPIEPIWLCPVQLRPTDPSGRPRPVCVTPWPLYPMQSGMPYVNVGFWSTILIEPGHVDGDVNRAIERKVGELGGHKSLYSDAHYDESTFHTLYGGDAYAPVKKRYDPLGRFPTLYAKAVRAT